MDVVDEAEVIVGEKEGVGGDAQNTARAAVHHGFAGDGGEKSGDEGLWNAVCGGEADDAVAGADARMACAMECDEEARVEQRIVCAEVRQTERRAVRGEGGVGGGDVFAGGKRWRRSAEVRV